jgi:hypothetical protein
MSKGQYILIKNFGLFVIKEIHSRDNLYIDCTLKSVPVFEKCLKDYLKIDRDDELRLFFNLETQKMTKNSLYKLATYLENQEE